MAQTIEERLTQLEKAHSRLFNQYQNLIKDFEDLKRFTNQIDLDLYESIKELKSRLDDLGDTQPKQPFVNGNRYQDVIEEIVSTKKVGWNNKIFLESEIKLKKRPELYKIFVLEKNQPETNDKISFIF